MAKIGQAVQIEALMTELRAAVAVACLAGRAAVESDPTLTALMAGLPEAEADAAVVWAVKAALREDRTAADMPAAELAEAVRTALLRDPTMVAAMARVRECAAAGDAALEHRPVLH